MAAIRHLFFSLLLAATLAPFAVVPASAADLDTYRAQGVIAERFDGFVELHGANGPADAKSLVDQVNAQRRTIYAQRAQAEKVPLEDVGKIYAAELRGSAPAGTYFKQADGSYVKK